MLFVIFIHIHCLIYLMINRIINDQGKLIYKSPFMLDNEKLIKMPQAVSVRCESVLLKNESCPFFLVVLPANFFLLLNNIFNITLHLR